MSCLARVERSRSLQLSRDIIQNRPERPLTYNTSHHRQTQSVLLPITTPRHTSPRPRRRQEVTLTARQPERKRRREEVHRAPSTLTINTGRSTTSCRPARATLSIEQHKRRDARHRATTGRRRPHNLIPLFPSPSGCFLFPHSSVWATILFSRFPFPFLSFSFFLLPFCPF